MRQFLIIILLSVTYLSCSDKVTLATWNSIGNFPGVGRQNGVAFSSRNKVYVGLGDDGNTSFNDLWEFDRSNNIWSRKADFPGNVREPIFFSSYDYGFIMSGHCGCKDFWSYNPETDKWTKKADCPVSDLYHAAVFKPGQQYAYVCAGLQNGSLQKSVWRYDLRADKWDQMKDFPGTPVEQAVGFSIYDKGYIATGNKAGGKSNELWQYNPETDSWNRKADFPHEVSGCVAFSFDSEASAYVGLGDLESEFYVYKPYDDKWSKTIDFIGGRRTGAVTFELNSLRYLGLGASSPEPFPKEMWEFKPETRAK
jgi:N-acetylneuraminic acid mutarotase